ncbi:hypothetical protein [uncultured Friedmanniella sp.]|uniref:hypothetical protein n=1 Tax=uncultured Friedmanniella sp. TaxID=335381 RepID=UPI0035CBA1E5
MTDSSVYPEGDDTDSEPTMTAPPEGRPDGDVAEGLAEQGVHAPDADDQSGSEAAPEV